MEPMVEIRKNSMPIFLQKGKEYYYLAIIEWL